jgi:hypothetical protein
MSDNEVKRQLLDLRSLFTEQSLIMSVVLDIGVSVEHMRDPMIDGLQTIQEAIAETLQALQEAAPVAAEPGPTNGAGRSALRTALADAMGRVLGAKRA